MKHPTMQRIDQDFHDIIKRTNPSLYDCIEKLVSGGYTPLQIARQAQKKAGEESVLSGMIEGTARIISDHQNQVKGK